MPLQLQPLNDRSLADRVAEQLREAIQMGAYAPGFRLVERRIAAELGVSHIPVREALARLAEEGLVTREPRRGSRVASIDTRQLEELSGLRVVLERYVVERAQAHWTPEIETALRKIVAQMEQAAARGDTRRLFDLDVKFHEGLWATADHPLLQEIVAQLRGRISGFLRAANAALDPASLEAHAATHGELLDTIATGTAAEAQDAMARHITEATDRIQASRARLTDGAQS
jgi:DNA-binding GntR family transcriptional regulator